MEQTISNMFSEAASELNDAEFELNRPIEDVVVFAVCANTKGAIRKMLTAYLAFEAQEQNGPFNLEAKLNELDTMGTVRLFNECIAKHQAFGAIDTSPLECCRGENDRNYSGYCLEIDKVKLCTELGRTVEQTIRQFSDLKSNINLTT
jgi:hypothetical protein